MPGADARCPECVHLPFQSVELHGEQGGVLGQYGNEVRWGGLQVLGEVGDAVGEAGFAVIPGKRNKEVRAVMDGRRLV